MALFIDVHRSLLAGATADDVARAHAAHRDVQGRHGVRYISYRADPAAGKVFCLVDAPTAEAASTVHRGAHGLIADEIYPVVQG